MRGFTRDGGIALRRAANRVTSQTTSVEPRLFEEKQAQTQALRTMQLNAAAVMLNRALAEYSDEGRSA